MQTRISIILLIIFFFMVKSTLSIPENVTAKNTPTIVDVINIWENDYEKAEAFRILYNNNQFSKKFLHDVLKIMSFDYGRKSIFQIMDGVDHTDNIPLLLSLMSHDDGKLEIVKKIRGPLTIDEINYILEDIYHDSNKNIAVKYLLHHLDNLDYLPSLFNIIIGDEDKLKFIQNFKGKITIKKLHSILNTFKLGYYRLEATKILVGLVHDY